MKAQKCPRCGMVQCPFPDEASYIPLYWCENIACEWGLDGDEDNSNIEIVDIVDWDKELQ